MARQTTFTLIFVVTLATICGCHAAVKGMMGVGKKIDIARLEARRNGTKLNKQSDDVNGWNCVDVELSDGRVIKQTRGDQWTMTGQGTQQFTFESRDPWSVYLRRGGYRWKLDIWEMAFYRGNSKRRDIDIATGEVNGYTARTITYVGSGGIGAGVASNDDGTWMWVRADGVTDTLRFVARDKWSVYLQKNGGNVEVQLDMWRDRATISWPGNSDLAGTYPLIDYTSSAPQDRRKEK